MARHKQQQRKNRKGIFDSFSFTRSLYLAWPFAATVILQSEWPMVRTAIISRDNNYDNKALAEYVEFVYGTVRY